MSDKKVIIIGAGCTGLSAAYTLKKQGVDFVVYEATNVVGGRCRSVPEDGYDFYAGAGSTEPQWQTTFQYLEELNLTDRVFTVPKQRYAYKINGKLRTVFLGGNLWDFITHIPENLKFLFTGFPLKTYGQLVKVFGELSKHMKNVDVENHNFEALAEISKISTEEFVVKHGGREALNYIFHPLLSMMVLGHARDISIAHPIALFSLMKGMCSIDGGLGLITAGLYEKVKESVQLNTPVKKVVIENGKVMGVELEDGFVEADHVIVGLDAKLALDVIPDLPEAMRSPLETCKYSSSFYYQFGLEEPLIKKKDTPVYVVMLPPDEDTLLASVSLGSAAEKPVLVIGTRGWEDDKLMPLSKEERRRGVISEVQKLYPEFPDEPKITKVFRWDRAVNLESPGQYIAIQDLIQNHMHDIEGLHLGGSYLFLIACTEGAMATGKQAAEYVIEELTKEGAPA